jgi:hypothetical protein
MNNSTAPILACLLAALCLPAWSQQKPAAEAEVMAASAPGRAAVARMATVTATVEAVDAANRKVTLKGPRGKVFEMAVDPEVRNLEQVKVGDQVVVRYFQALSLALMKDGKELRGSTTAGDAVRTPAGARPGAAVSQQVEVTADVIAVNSKTQTVTLRGPKQVVDLKIPDRKQFKLVKVGDQIHAVYTEALAVAVEPVAKK